MPLPPTGFARLSPAHARGVIALLLLGAAAGVATSLSPLRRGYADAPGRGASDLDLYRAEVARMQAGVGYYEAAAAELRGRGYPTRSVFNWRAVLPMWLVARTPDPRLAQALLGAAALAVLLLGFDVMARESGVAQALLGGLALVGALLPCYLGDLHVAPELWSGVLIALSACGYVTDRRWLGVADGVAAIFFRELAAPWCLVCLVLAARERRWRELAAWAVGLAAYATWYALHVHTVLGLMGPQDRAQPHGWLQLGGLAFVVATTQMNAWLLLLPQWVTALVLALSLLGFAGWHSPAGQRIGIATCLYVAAFAVVGQEFNQYWGSMYAPLLCFGLARAPASLRDLWGVAVQDRTVTLTPRSA
jgi:hypothetical protein